MYRTVTSSFLLQGAIRFYLYLHSSKSYSRSFLVIAPQEQCPGHVLSPLVVTLLCRDLAKCHSRCRGNSTFFIKNLQQTAFESLLLTTLHGFSAVQMASILRNSLRKSLLLCNPTKAPVKGVTSTQTGAVLPEPEKVPFGLFGIVCTVIPGLLIGATISKYMANFLEENDLFVPSDDDDDDD